MNDDYIAGLGPVIGLLTETVQKWAKEAICEAPHSIDFLVQEALRVVARGTTEGICRAVAAGAVLAAKRKGFKIERSPEITFSSIHGEIKMKSPYMRSDAGKGCRPVNDLLRVHGRGRTVQLERVLCDFGLDASFDTAAAKVKEHYGLEVHRTTILRTVTNRGQSATVVAAMKALKASDARPPTGPAGPRLLAEMDGSSVRTGRLIASGNTSRTPVRDLPVRRRVTEWRDLRLAFVRPLDDEGAAAFVGGIYPFDEVADQLLSEAHELGWTTKTFTLRVTDGGAGLREVLDARFPAGEQVLDKPHMVHHLHETATETEAADDVATVVRDWAARISGGQVIDVIAELRQRAKDSPGYERAIRLANHLERFRDAVHYDDLKRRGLLIGSGEIESAHKSEVQARMKLPGTWWTTTNANNVLALRLVRTNGRWDSYWKAA